MLSDGTEIFQAFLKSEYSDENIEFWRVCEDYKKIKSSFRMSCRAKMIFKRYIQAEAVREVGGACRAQSPSFLLSWTLTTSNHLFCPPPDQHRPQNQRRDPREHQDPDQVVLRRRPEDRLQPHGEGLLPTVPRVGLLPHSASVRVGASENIKTPGRSFPPGGVDQTRRPTGGLMANNGFVFVPSAAVFVVAEMLLAIVTSYW